MDDPIYRKSSSRSRPLIQVYSIRGWTIYATTVPREHKNHIFLTSLGFPRGPLSLQQKSFALVIELFEVPLIEVYEILDLK